MSTSSSANPNPKHAWSELTTRGLPKRSASERVHDFLEIYGLMDEETARDQASRCIQCPNPTCVSGCPLCNPIPEWMQLTAEGKFLEAAAVLGSKTNLAEICARICPSDRLCEHTCILDGVMEPVSIRALEQFLADYAFHHGEVDSATAPPTGRKVALIGSGAAGLACADELAKAGHSVTIFDSGLVPGGLLVNGVPAFRLERSVVSRRIEILKKQGVKFRLGVKLGEQLSLTSLRSEFDSVFLGFDSRQSRPLEVPGADLKGVVPALSFLLQKTTPVELDLPELELANKRVIVIGGGDTAMDCVRAALRWGAAEAICVYRRDASQMPCSPETYRNALDEGARFVFRATPVEVLGTNLGAVAGLRAAPTEPMKQLDFTGRELFKTQPGSMQDLETDWIIPALGFDLVPCIHESDFAALQINAAGGLIVDGKGMTNLPGVFAAGDIVTGPRMILDTVRDARRAAKGITKWLADFPSPARSVQH